MNRREFLRGNYIPAVLCAPALALSGIAGKDDTVIFYSGEELTADKLNGAFRAAGVNKVDLVKVRL